MSASFVQKLTTKALLITGTSIAIVAGGFATLISKTATISPPKPAPIRIQLPSHNKTIKLSDAIPLETTGLEQASAQALSLATADFDEDGMPDLIGGYANGGVGYQLIPG
jgi:hypothetical protein